MPNYNKVILIGHMTRDPKLRQLPSGTSVCDFGVAVNRTWTGEDGQKKEETCFVDCSAFGRTAENINRHFQKGRSILVEGRLRHETWESKEGGKRSKHVVVAETFAFVGGPPGEVVTKPPAEDAAPPPGVPTGDDIPF